MEEGSIPTSEEQRILDVWAEVLQSGQLVLGPQLEAFEREFATYIGVKHCVGVSSGTDALSLILRATIQPGDEVIVPALTFIATAEAVIHAGGVPVFCDVDPDSWCVTPETVEPHLTGRSAALLAVDLFGNPAPFNDLARFGLPIVEDACQAAGSSYKGAMCGSLGNAGAFSFYPSKNLAGCGDGGAVTTDDDEIARRVRLLRHHGSADGREHFEIGGTHRLDELQAAALRVRLPRLDDRIALQREQARALMAEGHVLQAETGGGESSWHLHVTCEAVSGPGRRYYEIPLHQQPSLQRYWRCDLPNAEHFGRTNVCLSPVPITLPA